VVGIDLATKALRVAQLHALEAGTPNIQYHEVSVEQLAQEQPASFDVVTCMEMLEHVPDPASIVRACAQLVKPGGWVFFHHQPQCQGFCAGDRGCRIHAQDDSQRDA
jgi:2-polyprenyl-6-hydroxyphenyl methylase/3-demethylubiquinone-9 3-methyltransferase